MPKQSIDKNRALMFRAALETARYAATALIEFLDKAGIQDATSAEIDHLVGQLGGGDDYLIEVLDDALKTLALERTNYIRAVGLTDRGAATYKVR